MKYKILKIIYTGLCAIIVFMPIIIAMLFTYIMTIAIDRVPSFVLSAFVSICILAILILGIKLVATITTTIQKEITELNNEIINKNKRNDERTKTRDQTNSNNINLKGMLSIKQQNEQEGSLSLPEKEGSLSLVLKNVSKKFTIFKKKYKIKKS